MQFVCLLVWTNVTLRYCVKVTESKTTKFSLPASYFCNRYKKFGVKVINQFVFVSLFVYLISN